MPPNFHCQRSEAVAHACAISEAGIFRVRLDRVYTGGIFASLQMTRTSVFQSNRSQAVRLPKEVAFPEGVRAVEIIREGKRRVIVPADAVWDDFFDAPGIELPDREQPRAQNRDEF